MARELTTAVTDRSLADAIAQRGDEAAFRELYRRHTPRLYQLILRFIGGNAHDAEDVVQDAWIQATKALPGFRWEAGFGSWLTGIGLNRARELLRSRGRHTMVVLDDTIARGTNPPVGEKIDLERAIALLPDGYRTVLVLHDIEGFTHEQIATRLEIATGTSKSQLTHARRAMRALLEGVRRKKSDLMEGVNNAH
jgi:RNA polymerase sigma factor (sigma-70 family)